MTPGTATRGDGRRAGRPQDAELGGEVFAENELVRASERVPDLVGSAERDEMRLPAGHVGLIVGDYFFLEATSARTSAWTRRTSSAVTAPAMTTVIPAGRYRCW